MTSAWEIKGIGKFPKVANDIEAPTVIVGGGLAGLWCAYLLAREGEKVVLVEKDRLGRAATLYTTAFITQVIDTSLTELEKSFGSEAARLVWQAHGDAIDRIEKVVQEEGIDCEFTRTRFDMYARDPAELESFEAECHLAKRFGAETSIRRTPLPGFVNAGAWIVENQAKFHPMKFLAGLAEAAVRSGVEIYEKTEAVKISGKKILTIETKNGKKIKAERVIVATYQPFNNPRSVHFKKGMYESYVYELETKKGLILEGLYQDGRNPYHYFRLDPGKRSDRLIVGGEDHRSELLKPLKRNSFHALREYIEETFPDVILTTKHKWHGGILEPSDGLALIGQYKDNQYLASAFSGNGMTYSALAGSIISDLIFNKKNQYASVFDPCRSLASKATLRKARDYTEELFGGAGKNLFK